MTAVATAPQVVAPDTSVSTSSSSSPSHTDSRSTFHQETLGRPPRPSRPPPTASFGTGLLPLGSNIEGSRPFSSLTVPVVPSPETYTTDSRLNINIDDDKDINSSASFHDPSLSGAGHNNYSSSSPTQSEYSTRRKPVPVVVPPPSYLPASHPFAAGTPSNRAVSIKSTRSAGSGSDSPITPKLVRMEDDVFFEIPRRGTPPPPPRRMNSQHGNDGPRSVGKERVMMETGLRSVMSAGDECETVEIELSDSIAASKSPDQLLLNGNTKVNVHASPVIPSPTRVEMTAKTIESETTKSRPVSTDHPLPPVPTVKQKAADTQSISTTGTAEIVTPVSVPIHTFQTVNDDLPGPRRYRSHLPPRSQPISHAASLEASSFSDCERRPSATSAVSAASVAPTLPSKTNVKLYNSTKSKSKSSKPKKEPKVIRKTLLNPPEPEEDESFSVSRVPSQRRLWEAGTYFIKDENGKSVCFGDLFPKWPQVDPKTVPDPSNPPKKPRLVVFFIRNFWCGQCQDYMFASVSLLDPEALEKANIKVIIIGEGSWKVIKSYKKLFNCPFPIYVDGPRRLYWLMGMIKLTNNFGPWFNGRADYHQRPVPTQVLHGLNNAFFRMKLGNPGKLLQLGGEFILGPGYECEFAHRMTTTSDHMEAPDVLRIAGCAHPTKGEAKAVELQESQRAEIERLEAEMSTWREGRAGELERMRRKKAARRGMEYVPPSRPESGIYTSTGLDEELGEGWEVVAGDSTTLGPPVTTTTTTTTNGSYGVDGKVESRHIHAIGEEGEGESGENWFVDGEDGTEGTEEEVDMEEMDRRFEKVMQLEREKARAAGVVMVERN